MKQNNKQKSLMLLIVMLIVGLSGIAYPARTAYGENGKTPTPLPETQLLDPDSDEGLLHKPGEPVDPSLVKKHRELAQKLATEPFTRTLSIPKEGETSLASTLISYNNFDVNRHGYSFANYSGLLGQGPVGPEYGAYAVWYTFGDKACLVGSGPSCVPYQTLYPFMNGVQQSITGGRCYGIAATSGYFFRKWADPGYFGFNYAINIPLKWPLAYYIAGNFAKQATIPAGAVQKSVQTNMTPAQMLEAIVAYTQADSGNDLVLGIYNQSGGGGHAITPIGVVDVQDQYGPGWYVVAIYDNNHPRTIRRLYINYISSVWFYPTMGYIGDASTHTLAIVPNHLNFMFQESPAQLNNTTTGQLSSYLDMESLLEHPTCTPWCQESKMALIWSSNNAQVLIENGLGQRIGYTGDTFVNEIDSAFKLNLMAGGNTDTAPIYYVPTDSNYTIQVNSRTQQPQQELASVAQIGPGYAVTAKDITLWSATQLQSEPSAELAIATDGKQASYETSQAEEIDLSMAVDKTDISHTFSINNVLVGDGQSVDMAVDTSNQIVTLSNSNNQLNMQKEQLPYELNVRRTTRSAGQQTFASDQLSYSDRKQLCNRLCFLGWFRNWYDGGSSQPWR